MTSIDLWRVPNFQQAGTDKNGKPVYKRGEKTCPHCLNDGIVTLDKLIRGTQMAVPCPMCRLGEHREKVAEWWQRYPEDQKLLIKFDGGLTIAHTVCFDCTRAAQEFRLAPPEGCPECKKVVAA